MQGLKIIRTGLTLGILLNYVELRAIDLVPAGFEAQTQTEARSQVRGGQALFYNPAFISLAEKPSHHLSLSLIQVTYSYQHPDTNKYPASTLKILATPVDYGYSLAIDTNLKLGLALQPLGNGKKTRLKNVPLELFRGQFEPLNIERSELAFRMGAGLGYEYSPDIHLGTSIVVRAEREEVSLLNPKSHDRLRKLQRSGLFYYAVSGLFLGGQTPWKLSLAYQSALKKPYKGKISENLSASDKPSPTLSYQSQSYGAHTLALGFDYIFDSWKFYLDLEEEFWQYGKGLEYSGLSSEDRSLDLVNVLNQSYGLGVDLNSMLALNLGLGFRPSRMGYGDPIDSRGRYRSAQLGDLSVMHRTLLGLGLRWHDKNVIPWEGVLGFSYQQGTRKIPANYTQPGHYSLRAFGLHTGFYADF